MLARTVGKNSHLILNKTYEISYDCIYIVASERVGFSQSTWLPKAAEGRESERDEDDHFIGYNGHPRGDHVEGER